MTIDFANLLSIGAIKGGMAVRKVSLRLCAPLPMVFAAHNDPTKQVREVKADANFPNR